MGYLSLKIYTRTSKIQFKFNFAFCFILLATVLIAEILFADIKNIKNQLGPLHELTGIDYDVFYWTYGGGQITLQGYIFGFAFFLLLSIVYYVFSSNLMAQILEEEIVISKVKNTNFFNSIGKYFLYIDVNNIFAFSISWVLVYLSNVVVNAILKTSINFLNINLASIITSIICLILYSIIIKATFLIKFRKSRVIKLLREIY